jgi:phage terminase large subunit
MATVTIQADHRIENMLVAMRDNGLPRNQAETFTRAGYVPLEGMLPFHAAARQADKQGGPEWIALGGKRGPGKSHTIMAQVGLDDCQRVDNLKVLFLRKIMKSAKESMEDVVRRVFQYTPHTPTADGISFQNGSRMIIGGFKDEKDIEKYLGIEYDVIVIEECTQISETKKDKLRGSLRTSKPNWRPRIYLSTNSDGIGLAWFKRMFVEPFRKQTERVTRFFDVTHVYNPFVNPEYEAWLNSLTGPLKHVVQPFEIPSHWVKWKGTDWGFASPFSTHWYTKDPDTRRIFALTDRLKLEHSLEVEGLDKSLEKIYGHRNDPS